MLKILLLISIILIVITAYSVDKQKIEKRIKAESNIGSVLNAEIITNESATITPIATPSIIKNKIYLGMWTEGFWDDSKKELHTEKLKNLEATVEKKMAIAHYYRGWEYLKDSELINELNSISANGWRPMLSVNPYFFKGCLVEKKSIYKAIGDGDCDEFLNDAAKNLNNFSQPFFLRFAWEMNIPEMEWGMKRSYSTPEEFISAWRRFYQLLKNNGNNNIIWVFSPNVATPNSIPFAKLYPGNEYVDWIGLDGYNKGTAESGGKWLTFDQVFRNSYLELTSIAPNKPMMIAEVNSENRGGDKGAWYENALNEATLSQYPQLQAIVFYNENRISEGFNWLIDITKNSFLSFKLAINQPQFASGF